MRPGHRRGPYRPEKGAKGITLFAVETTKDGFSRGRKLDKVGMEESDTAEMFFENVRVTDAEIIGELNMGFIHMMQKLAQERLSCSVANVAHAKQILVETLQYAKDRQAFGQSIGNFQHNKFLLAELFTQIEVAEATSTSASRPTRPATSPPSRPPRPSTGPRRRRARCSTTASSCTAATAS